MHRPAAEALLEGAEYGIETEEVAGSSDAAAAAAGMRPPRPADWTAAGAAGALKNGQMSNASAEAAATVAGGAAEDGLGAPLATTHGPPAKILNEGAGCNADIGNAAEAPVAAAAAAVRVRPPRPANWGTMTRVQRRKWSQ